METIPSPLSRIILADLCTELPPPADDTPEARADRDEYAIAAVLALQPADAFESRLAVRACHRA